MAGRRRDPGAITVIVTVLRDPRVRETLASLAGQTRAPAQILVADGGGADGEVRRIAEAARARDPRIVWLDAPGTIAESRNRALASVTSEFVAFLDADEVAPPGWLDALTRPFADPTVGFTGGPTPAAAGTVRGAGVRYYDAYLRRFYDEVARRRPTSLPMGNSVWRAEVFDRVGPLDTTLYPRASSEDQEYARRVVAAGWKGLYVAEASVVHDFSDLTTAKILAKQSRYALGGFVVWRRTGSTYEASGGRLAPYVLLPAIAVIGGIVSLLPGGRLAGALLAGVGLAGLGLLALGLTMQGLAWDRRYPGMRYRAFEILRRWATLLGAARGLRRYGWSGRRGLPSSPPAPPPSGKP